ncbi:acyltransferase family protein [Verrucomicrobiota bacterium sgz303538]
MIAEQSLPAHAVVEPITRAPSPVTPAPRPARLVSLDAYRGFVMLLMISAGLNIPKVAAGFKDSAVWQFLAHQTDHAAWRGCTVWDLIQPSFMFMVGVALPYSVAARSAQGQPFGKLFLHALWRAFALVALGLFLSSTGRQITNFSFAIVLAQIGLGYPFLWLLAWTKPRTQFVAAILILVGYWAAFALYPIPPADFSYQQVGVPPDWSFFQGFEAHWQKNANFAASVDQWFLNLFPQEKRFEFNVGGYETLNFIPSLATMIFGLIAGGILRGERSGEAKFRWLGGAGLVALAVGAMWDFSGLCPMVKRIWTPSFAIFSAGWAFLLLAIFYGIIDLRGHRRWAFPLVVAGMNSIALYCMSMLLKPWIRERLKLHLGRQVFESFGATYAPMVEMASILIVLWLIAFWMYRRNIFLRI